MHTCAKCGKSEKRTTFNLRANGRPTSYCQKCQRAYCKRHYVANKSKHNGRRYERRKRERKIIRSKLLALKTGVPCPDCKITHPYWRMHFDHLPQYEKRMEIASMVRLGFSWSNIEAEIAKCELVCANCHADRTYERLRVAQPGRAHALGA
jgi:hypothetical protein